MEFDRGVGADESLLEALGYDSDRLTAVALGVGLERLAMLQYGIDDIRRMEAERVC